jgi:hypothetical protein
MDRIVRLMRLRCAVPAGALMVRCSISSRSAAVSLPRRLLLETTYLRTCDGASFSTTCARMGGKIGNTKKKLVSYLNWL